MRKNFIFSILLVALFIGLNLSVVSQTVADNEVVTVENLMLEETKVTLACPFQYINPKANPCPLEDRQIRIATNSTSAYKNGWTYYYFVTGGKIIGEGANVVWDFTGAKPGDYSITVGVGKDGVIKGNLITKMIMAYACECHIPCSCPSIYVSGPETYTKRGDALIFTAKIEGGKQDKIIYNWKVSDGVIVFGQGTKQILVRTSKNSKAENISVTLEVEGQCYDCPREFSASSQFAGRQN